jgi:hypothetical protein
MSAVRPLLIFGCGLYIGKYYPQYVPLPQLSKENINKVLKYLESMERETTEQQQQQQQQQPIKQQPPNTPN